jgi:prolyl-tRNA synthetase
MRFSQLFGRTLREAPADAETDSYALAVRAGLVSPAQPGGLAYLPLGWRALKRIADLARARLYALGGQDLRLPVSVSGEEAVAELARRQVESYRQLPRLLYQAIGRQQGGPGFGASLLRPREANLVEAFSLHANEASMNETADNVAAALGGLFEALGVQGEAVEAGLGPDPKAAHAYVVTHPQGPAAVLRCDQCDYAALAEAATADSGPGVRGEPMRLEKVATPDCHTIADLARFLRLEERQTLKAVFYARDGAELVFAVIRGDLDVNEARLAEVVGGRLRPATNAEIEAAGAVAGYASPAGLKLRQAGVKDRQESNEITVVADRSIESGSNYAAGANEAGYHFVNVNYPRDFASTYMADIAQAREGQACPGPTCSGTLRARRGFEIGRVARHGTRYSVDSGGNPRVTALDPNGKPQLVWLGAYRLEVDRLLAAVLEAHHDGAGIVWPAAAAPFDVHVVSLLKSGDHAERLYKELKQAGYAVLLDDRPESAGVKFADADLIGCPVRLTVSDRSLKAGGVEWKRRDAAEREVVALADVTTRLAGRLRR